MGRPARASTRASAPATVVVPWRATPERERLWWALRARWQAQHPDWPIVEGTCPDDGPWRKGVAVADGIGRAATDVVIVADADVWMADAGASLEQAVAHVAAGTVAWAMPHNRVIRLTPRATADLVDLGAFHGLRRDVYMQHPYVGMPGGGLVVTRRDVYEAAPIDPRFSGWGQEDISWAYALRVLYGREWRGLEDLWHLWHEPAPRMNRDIGSTASKALYDRYTRARDAGRMRALIAEGRVAV